jgi:uncharacterized membrane protein YfcA
VTPLQIAGLVVAAALGGAINSIAGGGSLVTFPVAIAAGLTPLAANATNSVGLTPASLATAWAYRRELRQDSAIVRLLALPAFVGAILGAGLLLVTPTSVFDTVVPLLVLFATGLLVWQNVENPHVARAPGAPAWVLPKSKAVVFALELAIAIYGGYFGAGIGIMTLALFSLLGGRDIHRMNGVKILMAALINGVASVGFVIAGIASLPVAAILFVGGSVGGYAGASLARRADPKKVRWLVVAIGVVLSASLAYRKWFA